jgi:tetratricopeptide (TPR) repeat protein
MGLSKTPVTGEYGRNDRDIDDLQHMINSVRLDGEMNAAKVDELAAAIKTKLNVSSVSPQLYRDMAESMCRQCNIGSQKSGSPPPPQSSPPSKEEGPLDAPTWSQESSSPEPATHEPSISPNNVTTRRSPIPPPKSPIPTPDGMNRGRSPARSSNPNVPRPNRSRTPVDRLLGRRRSRSPARTPSKSPLRRQRSKSPLIRMFRRGGSATYQDLPGEASPSVYYEARMNMDSGIAGTPTPQRPLQRTENKQTTAPLSIGRPPLASMNVDLNTNALSPPTPPQELGQSPMGPAGAPGDSTVTSLGSISGGSLKDLRLDDLKFNIGTSRPAVRSPHAKKSPTKRGRPRSVRKPVPSIVTTPKNVELGEHDYEDVFSPMEDTPSTKGTPIPKKHTTPWQEDVELHRASKFDQSVTTKVKGSAGDEPVRQRSRSPFRMFSLFNNTTPKEGPSQTDQTTIPTGGAPFTSPIPPFQAPEAVFAETVDRQQTAPTSMAESANATVRSERAPAGMPQAAASATADMAPKTPYEINNPAFVAPETADTAVNKKGRNTATPLMVDSTFQFQVDLSKKKSPFKNKVKVKRGVGGFRRGLGGSVQSEYANIPRAESESPIASETTTPSNVGDSMEIDGNTPPPPQTSIPAGMGEPFQFNIGVGDKSSQTANNKSRFKRNGPRIATRFQQPRSQSAFFSSNDMPKDAPESPLVQPSINSNGGFAGQKPQSSRSHSVNEAGLGANQHSMKVAMVKALREEGKSHYLSGDYRSSILKYTKAILSYTRDCMDDPSKELLSVLLSNRSAGLLMMGAYQAAAEDCQRALDFVSDPRACAPSSEAGPALRPKLYTRMARALLKLGEVDSADRAFSKAIETANASLAEIGIQMQDTVQLKVAQKSLQQVVTESTLGQTEVARLRDVMNKILSCTRMYGSTEREKNIQAIVHVNMALSTATGCATLHEQKVSLLATLKRWREVASHCERFAAANAKFDGCFTEDLALKHPFMGVAPARYLAHDFFGDSREDEINGAEMKLNSKSTTEAVLRLPHSMTPYYVRALRLEERYPAAESSLNALGKFVMERARVYDQARLRSFAWLPQEHDRLSRTKTEREEGDELFRNGEFDKAAARYAACLTIDSEGISEEIDGASAGGRLHAVLHCNRAACLMAKRRFHEALTECTAALRIHKGYMKAMLRRARCYSRLDRLEESVAEYKRWMDKVNQARNDPQSVSLFMTPCLFDGPHEASEKDIAQVKQELDELSKAKSKAEAAARADAEYRQQKQEWQNATSKNSQQEDAQRRRDYFYSQKSTSSRRWDSFADRGPKRSSKPSSSKGSSGEKSKPSSSKGTSGEKKKSPKKSPRSRAAESCHYTVLKIQTNASDADIKKAFRKMALKYHPDKNAESGAADMFRRAKEAHEVLADASSRRKYDYESRWKR